MNAAKIKGTRADRGGIASLIRIAYRNIWRNGRRTALCAFAVAIAVFFAIFMQGWINGMISSIVQMVLTFDTGHVSVTTDLYEQNKEYLPVQYPVAGEGGIDALITAVEGMPKVKAALPRISAYATLFDSSVKHALLWGINVEREIEVNDFNQTDRTDGLVAGRFPLPGENACAVGATLARKAGLKIGSKVPLKLVSAQFSDKYLSPPVVGLFSFEFAKFDENVLIMPFDRLARVLSLGGGTQQLVVYAERSEDSRAVKAGLKGLFGEGFTVREWTDNYWVALLSQFTFIFYLIFAVFIVVASFLIVNTVLMVIHERIKEIGMMGALGMTRAEIVWVFFLEAVFLSLIGAAAGCLVGGVSTYVLSLFPMDTNLITGGGMKDLPMSGTIFVEFSLPSILTGFAFGVAVSAACTIIPSLKSAFVSPVEALRR